MNNQECDELNTIIRQRLCRKTKDTHLIDDLAQDTLLKWIERNENIANSRYVAKICLNQFCSYCRAGRTRIRSAISVTEELPATDDEPSKTLEIRETSNIVHRAIDSLGDRDRELIQMRFIEGQSLSEIARRSGQRFEKLKSRLRRAMPRLRARLLKFGAG